jgi:hypothetical protein
MITQAANVSSVAGPHIPERRRITRWIKGGWVGVIAGALFMAVEMFLMAACRHGDMWDPVRLSASIVMGNQAVATSTPLSFDIVFIGLFMHFVLSILYAVILGMIIRRLKARTAVLVGAGFGLLLYLFHFHGLAAWYPWVASERNWITVVGHLVYGIAAAWMYTHIHVRELMKESGLSVETN